MYIVSLNLVLYLTDLLASQQLNHFVDF